MPPFETFDKDLAFGKERENDAWAQLLGKAEHKTDCRAPWTGNLAIEYATTKNGTEEPSGISICEADTWVHEFSPGLRLVMSTEQMRVYAARARMQGKVVRGGDGGFSCLALVPLHWFFSDLPRFNRG